MKLRKLLHNYPLLFNHSLELLLTFGHIKAILVSITMAKAKTLHQGSPTSSPGATSSSASLPK